MQITKLITGGQTGTDRAMMDFAIKYNVLYGGWCPKNRHAEDGIINIMYNLNETELEIYEQRTDWNARDSDGTLIIAFGEISGGTLFTKDCLVKYGKPYLVMDIFELSKSSDSPQKIFQEWVIENAVEVLNVAGPRESFMPGVVYTKSFKLLEEIFF